MADPFEALGGSISGGPPPPPPQQQSAPQPGWPGMNNPSAGPDSFPQQHPQPQYPPSHLSSVGNSSHFAGNSISVGFHPQNNLMGRANNSTAAAPQPQQQQLPGASAGYATHPAGLHQQQYQQQQQQQQVAATAPAMSWSTGTAAAAAAAAASSSGMFHEPAAAAAAATPKPAQHIISTSAAGGMGGMGGEGGAEWTPPADQMGPYHDMWTTASAGCPVPGTVSGRAAVQFFSRSGLPKDALKSIWSLCDPSLTGSIRRPGFFAAMRLIAIAQHQQQGQGPPPSSPPVPSVSALEATRLAPLPLPRMEGCFPQPTGGDGGSGSGGSGGLSSVPAAAAGPATTGAPALHAAATSATLPALGNFPAMPIVGVGGGEAAAAAVGVEQASANSKDKEEDDFGDFTGAQEEAQPPPAPPTDDDEEGDDFGDFSGAPASAAAAAPDAGSATAAGGDETSGDDIAWMMEDGDKNGGALIGPDGMEAEKGGGGLDDLIKSNLQATTAGPVHLAAMQSTPPLLGKAHDPVMVDRASVARSKLSVFDEMADLDLAVGQEDWNDFADETTAPPRSPTPPPLPSSPPAAAGAAGAPSAKGSDDAVPAAAASATMAAISASDGAPAETHDASQPPAPAREASVGNDDSGGGGGGSSSSSPLATAMGGQQEPLPFSPFDDVDVAPWAPGTEASAPALAPEAPAESQDDDWGDFEDASGRKEGSDGAAVAGGQDGTAASGAGDDGDEEWGTFADVPVVAEGGRGSGDGAELAAAEGPGGGDSADSPAAPQEAVDPFAEIAPSTPPRPSSLAYGDDEASPPGGNEEATTAVQEEAATSADVGAVGRSRGASMTAAGLPLSLRALRDALARQGRLEEAVEVQRRMELPSTPSVRPQAYGNAAGDGRSSSSSSGGGAAPAEAPGTLGTDAADGADTDAEGEEDRDRDRDLERWRAAVELPPAPTVDELEKTMAAADPARADRFRARFVAGRPPVEEEALAAGGGAAALAAAVRRQRAARRAVYLSSLLGAGSASKATTAGGVLADGSSGAGKQEGEAEVELEVGFGLGANGARPPPTLSDWALMTAYVTRTAEEGLAALRNGGGSHVNTGGETTTTPRPESPTPPPPPPPPPSLPPPTLGWGDVAAADAVPADASPGSSAAGGTGAGAVSGEVARSEKFEAFARGLREAVRVCRMTQAAAEDACCLEGAEEGERDGVAGFASMEKAWAELRRCAREATGAGGDDICSVFGEEEEEEEEEEEVERDGRRGLEGAGAGSGGEASSSAGFGRFSSLRGSDMPAGTAGGGGGSGGGRSNGGFAGSVKAVREACVAHAPAGSSLCAVSLQPLVVFGGGGGGGGGGGVDKSSPPPPGVVEYCGVRYLACAVNLWVNVLDKPPPGPLP